LKKRDIKRQVAARIFLRSLLGMGTRIVQADSGSDSESRSRNLNLPALYAYPITRLDCLQNRDVIENTFEESTVKLKTVQELTKKLMQNEDKYNTKLESEVESTESQTCLTRPQRKADSLTALRISNSWKYPT